MNSMQGYLLVASPHLPDENFFRTVVLIVQHDDEHAFGLVLNRPGTSHLKEVWSKVCDTPCRSDQLIRIGGPLDGPLMAIHGSEDFGEIQVLPGIYFATQRSNLQGIVGQKEDQFVVFSGYSGWAARQLDNELRVGGWMTIEADPEFVFADAEDLWHLTARAIGSEILQSTLNVAHVPDDPSMN